MALVISDRIKETTNTVGTQAYQLEGAVTGFETFASNLSDGDTTYYAVTDNTNFEVGLGTINEGTSQTINYTVTVANVGGINIFVLNGVNNPVITFVKGFTYVFDVSDNTNGSHPLRFRTSADASYTDGVSVSGTQGQAGATVTIVVASDAPSTLKYYCTIHGNAMGNTINVISAVATLARTTILASSNSNNAVSFGTGAKTIFCTLPAGKAVIKDASNNINGTFVGNITGNVTGNASGTAATVTGAAQTNITSVGTLTGLTIDGDATFTGANGNIVFDKSDNALEFADNVRLTFGDGGGSSKDLEIYSNGTNSIIAEKNSSTDATAGGLNIASNLIKFQNAAGSELLAKMTQDAGVELNHNNSKKFETTSDGVTVTGTTTTPSIRLDATGDVSPSSTSHPFQIGASNSSNIGMDSNEIMARNNGSLSNLKINDGALEVGSSDITLSGNIELGHASDTTIARSSAGVVQIEGNTIITTSNSDTPATTTSSSDADFVLVDDGGTMKKITPSNLGITAGAASLDDATALAIALG